MGSVPTPGGRGLASRTLRAGAGSRRQGHGGHRGAGSGADACGSHQGIDAPQPQELRPTRGATHFRILFVFERNAKRCFWWPATRPGIGGPWYDTKIPIAEYRFGPMDQETGGRMSEKKPTARPWSAVKRDAVASGAMAQERLEADKKRTIAEVRAHSLAEIRREQSTTQSELAKIMHVSQGRVSQIESGRLANSELGTLRSYVEALGGSLRIVADFGDGELTIID